MCQAIHVCCCVCSAPLVCPFLRPGGLLASISTSELPTRSPKRFRKAMSFGALPDGKHASAVHASASVPVLNRAQAVDALFSTYLD